VGSYLLKAVYLFNADTELLANYMDRWLVDFRKVMEAGWLKRIRSLRHKQNPHTEAGRCPMHRIWKLWGLAIPPSNSKNLDELTAWKLCGVSITWLRNHILVKKQYGESVIPADIYYRLRDLVLSYISYTDI
jgi:hypothetical protein